MLTVFFCFLFCFFCALTLLALFKDSWAVAFVSFIDTVAFGLLFILV